MKQHKFLAIWLRISGIIIAIIGILHSSFTPMMYNQMIKVEALQDKAAGMAYFFALAGVAFLFAGIITTYASSGIQSREKGARFLTIISSLFAAFGGITAMTYARFGNPLIYTMTACAILNLILLFTLRSKPTGQLT